MSTNIKKKDHKCPHDAEELFGYEVCRECGDYAICVECGMEFIKKDSPSDTICHLCMTIPYIENELKKVRQQQAERYQRYIEKH